MSGAGDGGGDNADGEEGGASTSSLHPHFLFPSLLPESAFLPAASFSSSPCPPSPPPPRPSPFVLAQPCLLPHPRPRSLIARPITALSLPPSGRCQVPGCDRLEGAFPQQALVQLRGPAYKQLAVPGPFSAHLASDSRPELPARAAGLVGSLSYQLSPLLWTQTSSVSASRRRPVAPADPC